MPSAAPAPDPTAGTAAIRAGIALLGTTGFALSYDALRQMAVALHIRGLLTYAFPLVIDGFIAIGVGALSAIPPLALAGAVHLYLLIRRRPAYRPSPPQDEPGTTNRHNDAPRRQRPTPTGRDQSQRRTSPETRGSVAESTADVAEVPKAPAKPKGRRPSATTDELLAIGRNAPRGPDGRISRRAVETAIRAKGHTVGKDRLVDVTRTLQAELVATRTDHT